MITYGKIATEINFLFVVTLFHDLFGNKIDFNTLMNKLGLLEITQIWDQRRIIRGFTGTTAIVIMMVQLRY